MNNEFHDQHAQQHVDNPHAEILLFHVEGEDQNNNNNNNNNHVVQGLGNANGDVVGQNPLPHALRREANDVIAFTPGGNLNYQSHTCIGVPIGPNTSSTNCFSEVYAANYASVRTKIYSNQFGCQLCTRCAARWPNILLEHYRWTPSTTEMIDYGTVEDIVGDGERRDTNLRANEEARRARVALARRLQREVNEQMRLCGTRKYYVTLTCTTEKDNRLVTTLVGEVKSVKNGLVKVNTRSGGFTYRVQAFCDLMHNRDTPAVREVFCNGALFAWSLDA